MRIHYGWLSALLLLLWAEPTGAQPVPRRSIVEHFTNTHCSICAGRNPGFFDNLAAFPEVLHIAYYPSAPYPACPFNQLNKAENDERTRFYGVYGSTPRLVINGAVIAPNADYNSPSLFQGTSPAMSDYSLSVSLSRTGDLSGEARIRIKKVAANSLSQVNLWAVVSEDTVRFNANNGETVHYDLFHKSLSGTSAQAITTLASVNDSMELVFPFTVGSGWGGTTVTALLQDTSKNVLQAARSSRLAAPMNVPTVSCHTPLCMYPVPAGEDLHFRDLPMGYHNYRITNAYGQIVQRSVVYDVSVPISLRTLPTGYYVITIGEGDAMRRGAFVKN